VKEVNEERRAIIEGNADERAATSEKAKAEGKDRGHVTYEAASEEGKDDVMRVQRFTGGRVKMRDGSEAGPEDGGP
jgi:hypothetical protein